MVVAGDTYSRGESRDIGLYGVQMLRYRLTLNRDKRERKANSRLKRPVSTYSVE